jgi:hypothetical protein
MQNLIETRISAPQANECNWKQHEKSQAEASKEFKTKSLGHIGRLPNFNRGLKYSYVERANRYLHFQEKRIDKAIKDGHIDKAIYIWMCLLKCSKSYQVQLFHRVKPNWYWIWPTTQMEETLFGAINKLRAFDLKLLINRFYILKKNGKWRPIGSPNYESRMISKALTDMVYSVSEKSRNPEQHGYLRNRGAWSAIMAIVQKLKEGFNGYEFDLKSFFNTVEPYIYFRKLEEICKPLTKVVGIVIKNIEYRYSELKPEAELNPKAGRINTLERRGVPQGLSLSPILSTWALEYYGRPNNLIMYADDGIYFYKHNISKFTRWIERMGECGVKIAPEKSGSIKEKFIFCGVEIDRTKEELNCQGETISWHNKNLEHWLKTVQNPYKKNKEWTWWINKEAIINHRVVKVDWITYFKVLFNSYWKAEMYKGYRMFPGSLKVYDILSSSSWASNEVLKIIKYKGYDFEKIKAFDWSVEKYSEIFSYAPKRKGIYRKHYNNGNPHRSIDRTYWEILQYHDLKLSRLKPVIER